MAVSSVFAFWGVAFLLIVVPGADWAFTVSAGLRSHSVVPAVSGLVVGYATVTAVVAAGVGALVAGSPAFLTALTLVGGLYLMWYGANTFAHPSRAELPTDTAPAPEAGGWSQAAGGIRWSLFLRGVGVSGLNPKGLLIFLALLPQFTDPHGSWPIAGQIGVLGLVFMITCAVFYLCLGTLIRTVLRGRQSSGSLLSRLAGASMVVIGAWLIIERLMA